MRFLSTYKLFESNGSMNSKEILKLFREHMLRQENLDLISNTLGVILDPNMETTKNNTTKSPYTLSKNIRFINHNSNDIRDEYTLCGIFMNPLYVSSEFERWCQYLNDISTKENDIFNRNGNLWYGKNYLKIELKCSKNRKMICLFEISCENFMDKNKTMKSIINIEDRYNCRFEDGNYMDNLSNFLLKFNKKIDELIPSVIYEMAIIKNNLYESVISSLSGNPKLIEIVKNYPVVYDEINKITNNGGTNVDSMLDAGFYD